MTPKHILVGFVTLSLAGVLANAQTAPSSAPAVPAPDAKASPAVQARPDAQASPAAPAGPDGVQNGPATVAPHSTRNRDYPTSIPEGAAYYIVVRGDTLWDISGRFLKNPRLWPQIWEANKYIKNAHWIWPGDPVLLPKLAVVAEQAGQSLPPGTPDGVSPDSTGLPGSADARGATGGTPQIELRPVTEETSLQCAEYVVPRREDESFHVIASEQGREKEIVSNGDVVYLNKGTSSGIKPGDMFTTHHPLRDVHHPNSGKKLGIKVATTGWLKVILAEEGVSTAIVEQACGEIPVTDYLKPFEKVQVPMVPPSTPADRLVPPSGKLTRTVVDIANNVAIAAAGDMMSIDAGAEDGLAPGSVLTVYRITKPSVPTPRNVIGEATVVAVREATATAKLTYTSTDVKIGDWVELR